MAFALAATQQQFDPISQMHAELICAFLAKIQTKDPATQASLCYQMNELGDYIAAQSKKGSKVTLEMKMKWIGAKRAAILKTLESRLSLAH